MYLILTNRNADRESHDRTSVASLTCEDEVTSFDVTIVDSEQVGEERCLMLLVTPV